MSDIGDEAGAEPAGPEDADGLNDHVNEKQTLLEVLALRRGGRGGRAGV